jgi:hypothetical protein
LDVDHHVLVPIMELQIARLEFSSDNRPLMSRTADGAWPVGHMPSQPA